MTKALMWSFSRCYVFLVFSYDCNLRNHRAAKVLSSWSFLSLQICLELPTTAARIKEFLATEHALGLRSVDTLGIITCLAVVLLELPTAAARIKDSLLRNMLSTGAQYRRLNIPSRRLSAMLGVAVPDVNSSLDPQGILSNYSSYAKAGDA
ncbi:hypothetical protein U1Q18_005218 [Sarracenia purpurea var. burkii]